jgi:hypothetical protein
MRAAVLFSIVRARRGTLCGFLTRLSEAGWPPAVNPQTLGSMQACPPFGIAFKGKPRRCCHQVRICPYCWARRIVGDLYSRVSRHLWRVRKGRFCIRRHVKHRIRLWTFEHQILIAAENDAELADRIRTALRERPRFGAVEMTGAYLLQHLVPVPEGVLLVCRGLVLVRRKAKPTGAPELAGLTWRRWPALDPQTVVKALTVVTQYPADLLRSSPTGLIPILDIVRRLRLHESYGCLRQDLEAVKRQAKPPKRGK